MDLLTLDTDSADDDITDANTSVSDDDQYTIYQFQKGQDQAPFLHTLFEEVVFAEPANSPHNTQVIKTLMETEQYEDAWLPVLQQLIDTVLATPLDGKALKLNQKTSQQCLVEMEFLLPIKVLQADALNQVVMAHDALSAQAGALGFETVKGMLKGFIDLIFEDSGRYYVLDWKSNYLGVMSVVITRMPWLMLWQTTDTTYNIKSMRWRYTVSCAVAFPIINTMYISAVSIIYSSEAWMEIVKTLFSTPNPVKLS